ncbi:pseudouridine synthase [Mycoplasmopsis iners]|uniref:pseudouridine synthase n=1 Tax=Mycoplasmopsis iners TaxID=76630 RepID=UPI0004957499|nr:RluA family pseudouridine synthase [Mycoplasmopsis iners]
MSANWKHFVVSKNNDQKKLLNFLKDVFNSYPLSLIYRLLRQRDVKINDKRVSDEKIKLNAGDKVSVFFANDIEKKNEVDLDKINIEFKIVYEDSNILLVDKPNGISMHSETNCLDHQVLKYFAYRNDIDEFKPSHVGRLDKETSGLVIYAKNYYALAELNRKTAFFDKIYAFKSNYNGKDREIILDISKNTEGFLNAKLTKQQKIEPNIAKTFIYKKNNAWFAKLETGRKHQIRLSMKSIGYPIWGDKKYSGKEAERLFLHCKTIRFAKLEGKLKYLNNKEFNVKVPWKE